MNTATIIRTPFISRFPVFVVFCILLVLTLVSLSLVTGKGDLSSTDLSETFLKLRALRTLGAFVTGAALACAGVVMQALFRNSLADPGVLGTTAGAGFGGQLAMVVLAFAQSTMWLGGSLPVSPELVVAIGCVAGAFFASSVLLVISHRYGGFLVLLLMGFLISSIFISLGAFVITLAQDSWELGRAVVAFTLGSVGATGKSRLLLALPLVLASVVALFCFGRSLDLLLSGEDEAQSLGVDVVVVRRFSIMWTAFLIGAAVSIGGGIGFVGLIVPHALRPLVGVNTRKLLVSSLLVGGGFVVLCDIVSRVAVKSGELPLGVVTGLVGAPLFAILLIRGAREGRYGYYRS